MSVQAVFEATAGTYEGARRRLIPCFDRFYGAAVELLPSETSRVLELGAGTGLFSAMLRERMPRAEAASGGCVGGDAGAGAGEVCGGCGGDG